MNHKLTGGTVTAKKTGNAFRTALYLSAAAFALAQSDISVLLLPAGPRSSGIIHPMSKAPPEQRRHIPRRYLSTRFSAISFVVMDFSRRIRAFAGIETIP